jgi:phospholipid/cholesterol/gamma-HCH transport system ATP-binding protein
VSEAGASAATDEALFAVRGLTRRYGDLVVLDGLDFEVRRGECLVILGRSGSGKSVTLRQLNGLEQPDSGSVVFDGLEITRLSERELLPVRRRVAMLFQGGALFDSMDVFENVAFPLREHTGLDEAALRSKVAEKLHLVRLEGMEAKVPASLSGGMKKRVALARSLALDPEAVLFDEPTTGLDPMTGATIANLILRTRAMGVTCVVVTHDLALARRVADRVAFLHGGRFLFLGTWEEAERCPDPTFQDFLAGNEEASHVAG